MAVIAQGAAGNTWLSYSLAVVLVLAAAAMWLAFEPWVDGRGYFLFFNVAVLGAGVYAGRGPAIVAALASLVMVHLLGWSSGSFWNVDLLAFGLAAGLVIWITGQVTRLRTRSIESERSAKARASVADELAEELNLLIEGATGYAIYMLAPSGEVTIWNEAAERLKGWREEEVLGRHCRLFYPQPAIDEGKPERDLAHALREGRLQEEDWRVRKDGSEFLANVTITALYDKHGNPKGFGKVIRDVTDQRAADQRIDELRSELVHAARVSAMGTMASTLAHELNQPLTAVANYVSGTRELVRGGDPADRDMIVEGLTGAYDEALRAGAIVRRLREFIDRGEVEKSVENLHDLVDAASKLALIGARERGIVAHFDLDPAVRYVLVNKVQTQQVLINLMRNAIEAMCDCPTRVLTVCTRPEEASFVRVTVADTGPGVEPEIAQSLFRAFNSTKSSGMGLGLSICRTIVEANGGRIWMERKPGGGTYFHFTLIRADLEEWE